MKTKHILIIVTFIIFISIFVHLLVKANGDFSVFYSADELTALIKSFGIGAPIVFFFIQTFQVILVPIPGNITALVGGMLFGFWQGFLISIAGLSVGSTIAFFLARLYGKPLVNKFIDKKITDKYINKLSNKYTILLFFLFLLPFFPDDALCFIAGLSAITYPAFIVLVLVARPPGMIFANLVGSGAITIPLWGWIIIGSLAVILMYLSIKYDDKIEKFILDKILKRRS